MTRSELLGFRRELLAGAKKVWDDALHGNCGVKEASANLATIEPIHAMVCREMRDAPQTEELQHLRGKVGIALVHLHRLRMTSPHLATDLAEALRILENAYAKEETK